jgi:hypothetical protein
MGMGGCGFRGEDRLPVSPGHEWEIAKLERYTICNI